MSNPIDPISEAKALKEQLTKLFRDFAERTKYMVQKVEIRSNSTNFAYGGATRDMLTDTELRKIVVQSSDGTVVEV